MMTLQLSFSQAVMSHFVNFMLKQKVFFNTLLLVFLDKTTFLMQYMFRCGSHYDYEKPLEYIATKNTCIMN